VRVLKKRVYLNKNLTKYNNHQKMLLTPLLQERGQGVRSNETKRR